MRLRPRDPLDMAVLCFCVMVAAYSVIAAAYLIWVVVT